MIISRRGGREVTAGDPCQRARNRNATRRVDGALPRERDVGISGRNYTGGDLKARATRIAARAPNKYIYIYSEKERERERFIVGYGSSAEPGQQIFGVSLFLRENAARRDVTEITKRALPLLALLSIPNPLLATRLVPVFNEISNVAKLFPLRIRIYIYIFPRGGWRAAFPSISSFIRWARRVFVRTYVRWYGSGIRVSCRGEEEIFIRRSAH